MAEKNINLPVKFNYNRDTNVINTTNRDSVYNLVRYNNGDAIYFFDSIHIYNDNDNGDPVYDEVVLRRAKDYGEIYRPKINNFQSFTDRFTFVNFNDLSNDVKEEVWSAMGSFKHEKEQVETRYCGETFQPRRYSTNKTFNPHQRNRELNDLLTKVRNGSYSIETKGKKGKGLIEQIKEHNSKSMSDWVEPNAERYMKNLDQQKILKCYTTADIDNIPTSLSNSERLATIDNSYIDNLEEVEKKLSEAFGVPSEYLEQKNNDLASDIPNPYYNRSYPKYWDCNTPANPCNEVPLDEKEKEDEMITLKVKKKDKVNDKIILDKDDLTILGTDKFEKKTMSYFENHKYDKKEIYAGNNISIGIDVARDKDWSIIDSGDIIGSSGTGIGTGFIAKNSLTNQPPINAITNKVNDKIRINEDKLLLLK